jgi:GPH family glycoside/pentoside/hexuronide:cation symporter
LPIAKLADGADGADADSVRIGGKRAGTYFAIFSFTEKTAIAFGTGVSLNVVGLLGVDPMGDVAGSSDLAVASLRLVYCLGSVVF